MGKGEIARYEQFLLFPQCFQKACFRGASKGVIVCEWVEIRLQILCCLLSDLFCLQNEYLCFHISAVRIEKNLSDFYREELHVHGIFLKPKQIPCSLHDWLNFRSTRVADFFSNLIDWFSRLSTIYI